MPVCNDMNMRFSAYAQQDSKMLPREKLLHEGVTFLSDEELISILIGSGVKGHSVFSLARKVLKVIDENYGVVTLESLVALTGLGKTKAMVILAALEMSHRIGTPAQWKITGPEDVLPLLAHYADRQQEHFIVLCLNGAHCVIHKHVVFVGFVNKSLVHPREVFSLAFQHRCAALIIAHNHPSGNVKPSPEDIEVTKMLIAVSHIMAVPILDHIIFSMHTHYSFASHGFFNNKKGVLTKGYLEKDS